MRYATWATRGVVVLCGMIFIRDYYFDFQHVKGSSMAPSLNPRAHEAGEEDSVIMVAWHAGVRERGRGRGGGDAGNGKADAHSDGIKRGDVVTFWKPHRPTEISIKRVVGLPGDTVYPVRGYAVDDGVHARRLEGLPDGLVDEDRDAVGERGKGKVLGKVVVPYGHLWIEGDNWRSSLDSNDFGPISKGLVIGKARWVWRGWWPFGEVRDAREMSDKGRTKMVEGKAEIPARFLD
ncbi:hypothetical protein LEMA_P083200.1 [Plenodomus lingam JN3]|uniref:Mitochondrial inner membrane protease subunit n=1 Tax=Leptosphaeria maculans (strain JN3 / isolate v23.1.3 / race Av1-4-5-6-7-8) TaxID=985895 RepID=E5A636_LEPMJ|nr:hypothetical protein LEMA_P083200.1 [Plenodomus lingam JN3]CBX99081.1 hypothetical protein LEMA_P083200.1 [Plenodomus lingam JN3]